MRKHSIATAFMLFVSLPGASLDVSVSTHLVTIPIGGDNRIEHVVFLDDDPTVRVFIPDEELAANPPRLENWDSVLAFEICRATAESETRSCKEASMSPLALGLVSGILEFRGRLSIEEPGSHTLIARRLDVPQADSIEILARTGQESSHVRYAWLQMHAESSDSWEEFKRYQLLRAELFPERLTPYQSLARKAIYMAPEGEAHEVFDLVISKIEQQLRGILNRELRETLEGELADQKWMKSQISRLRSDRALVLSSEKVGQVYVLTITDRRSGKVIDRGPRRENTGPKLRW